MGNADSYDKHLENQEGVYETTGWEDKKFDTPDEYIQAMTTLRDAHFSKHQNDQQSSISTEINDLRNHSKVNDLKNLWMQAQESMENSSPVESITDVDDTKSPKTPKDPSAINNANNNISM